MIFANMTISQRCVLRLTVYASIGELGNGIYSTLGSVVEQHAFGVFLHGHSFHDTSAVHDTHCDCASHSFTLIVQQSDVRSVGKHAAILRKPFLGFEGGWQEQLV